MKQTYNPHPRAVYMMKNLQGRDGQNQYLFFDKDFEEVGGEWLTPDDAKAIPLPSISPAQLHAKKA